MKNPLSYLAWAALGTVLIYAWFCLSGQAHYGKVTKVTTTFKNGELDQVTAHVIIEDTIEADVPVGGIGKMQALLLAASNNNMLDQYTAKVMFSSGRWRDVEDLTYTGRTSTK
jgi:hypothetical protein